MHPHDAEPAPTAVIDSSADGADGAGDASGRASYDRREALHRAIVRESPSPIFLVDVETRRILDANPALAELLGRPVEALTDLDLGEIDAGPGAELDDLLLRTVQQHHDILGEREFVRADGTRIPVEVSTNLVLVDGEEVVCVFARDIRDRREVEEAREELERQLWFSQKHEAVGRLAGGVAHDFNNLLMAVVLNCELVEGVLERGVEGEDREVGGEALGEIRDATVRARDLTRQLLAFSGKQNLRPRPVSLSEVVRDVQRLLRRTIGEDVELAVDLVEEAWTVRADPAQIDQVLLNLAVNARDAMPGGGRLTITTRNVELDDEFARTHPSVIPGPHVLLRVADTGHGMDAATRERVFEPFFTTKDKGKGTGLGLSTVYGIVKQSDGTIWVESGLGEGTTFDIYLPRVEEAPARRRRDRQVVAPGAPGGSETVLLVEDDDAVRTLSARILRSLGYSVLEADSGEAALQIHRSLWIEPGQSWPQKGTHAVDLLLTDVVMPGASGTDVVRRLRVQRPDLKVVYMTGYADPSFEGDEMADTRAPVLQKPVGAAALARTLRKVLDSA